ncbi:unnamed protein product [Dovyalis caffra]|uniref:peroxidase n=1 Tax=Dovyalis caffra TaxID=77055 RepID=A0AAV1QX32_9ROSI|nr:unnamed protein product [Dovyalis caffra]
MALGFKVKGYISYDFYEKSCPHVEDIVRSALQAILPSDPTAPAALLRLMFRDCHVQGCDATILSDPGMENVPMEMASRRNFGIQQRELIGI